MQSSAARRLLLATRQPAEAARVVEQVVLAAPDKAAALTLCAQALFASAEVGQAEKAFAALVAQRPG